jgi:uncharacterized phage protein (TIGR01671 family)
MRKIKFRAWDANYKKMFYAGDNSTFADTTGRLLDSFPDEHLMQFIGLKDKNGKEIYEGDVVHIGFKKDFETGTVLFQNGSYLVDCNHPGKTVLGRGSENYCEIIGNRYEHPELISTSSPSEPSASDTK